jgi:mannose-6-phosphate isomerase-like protein (cupin superfamily)
MATSEPSAPLRACLNKEGWPCTSNPVRLSSYVSRAIARREIAGFRPGFWQQGQSNHPTPPTIRAVQSWDVKEIQAPEGTRLAAVLETVDGARAIIVRLGAGEELGDHQVRERAWLMVVEGTARIEAGGDVVDAGPGTLLTLEPGERHSVASDGGARIVMILSSWPAEGHYPAWPGDDVPKA